jgi:putative sterol carrier protein
MTSQPRVTVGFREGERLNGLGMMMVQYLEQNLADFEYKAQQGLSIRGRVSVEVEKGVAITTCFEGDHIQVENGVCGNPDLFLRSSFITLSEVLSGKANPFKELLRGKVKLGALPRRPIQSLKILRFLRIPRELLLDQPPPSRKRRIIWWSVLGLPVLLVTIFLVLMFLSD